MRYNLPSLEPTSREEPIPPSSTLKLIRCCVNIDVNVVTVKLATFSATFLATSSKSLENQDIGQTDHVEHKYDLHFDLRLDLHQRTGNGLEVKVTDRFAIFLLQKIAYQNG